MRQLVATLTEWGPSGLFLFALLDGAGLPMPGGVDVLVVFLASKGLWGVWSLSTVAVIGSAAGNLLLFAIARAGGHRYLDKRTTSGNASRFRRWFQHYGLLTVFVSALVPLPVMPMKIFVLCAGALGSTVPAFLGAFVTARLIRYTGLAYLGSHMGENALAYVGSHLPELMLFAACLFFVLYLIIKFFDSRRTTVSVPK